MKINEIIIVEGKSDKQLLESFLDATILTTNGSAIDGFDFKYLEEISKGRGIIILTDPDSPGKKIKNEILQRFPNAKEANVRKENSIKHHKVGVAESSKEEILYALNNLISYANVNEGTLQYCDLLDLNLIGENSKKNREIVERNYNLGVCNGKSLLKKLNALNVSFESLKELLNDKQ